MLLDRSCFFFECIVPSDLVQRFSLKTNPSFLFFLGQIDCLFCWIALLDLLNRTSLDGQLSSSSA